MPNNIEYIKILFVGGEIFTYHGINAWAVHEAMQTAIRTRGDWLKPTQLEDGSKITFALDKVVAIITVDSDTP